MQEVHDWREAEFLTGDRDSYHSDESEKEDVDVLDNLLSVEVQLLLNSVDDKDIEDNRRSSLSNLFNETHILQRAYEDENQRDRRS